ncbi:MAG: hypothetical protein O3A01_08875 [bacterium]|nr:hypothetical protein [bacterium]
MPPGLPNLAALSITPYYEQYLHPNRNFYSDKKEYALRPPSGTTTFSVAQVGHSDLSGSSSEDEYHLDMTIAMRPKAVTVYGSDGRFKGSQLVQMAQSLSQLHARACFAAGQSTTNKNSASIETGTDFAAFAGAFAASKTKLEQEYTLLPAMFFPKTGDMKKSQRFPMEYTCAPSGAKTGERLHVSTELGKYLAKKGITQTDLTCAQMANAVDRFKTDIDGMTDARIATRQLKMLRLGEHKVSNGQHLDRFVMYMNAYMFGVEASRVNATFATGLMTLKLISAGKMTYKQALDEDGFGGRFPLAVRGSGSGNFKARKRLIEHVAGSQDPGMKTDRRHPQWLAISLKEGALIKTYMKHVEILDRTKTVQQQRDAMETKINKLLKRYFPENRS